MFLYGILINDLKVKVKLRTAAEHHAAVKSDAVLSASVLLDFADTLFQRDLQSRLNDDSCMQLVFPLEMVWRDSPYEKQKTRAMAYLHRLGGKKKKKKKKKNLGYDGLCTVPGISPCKLWP
ncbi:hypothetical protein N7501_010301 [Penicillium viridicatum]|nr:hypothetical protein N7501_010301 [Penicillium viridicatum]